MNLFPSMCLITHQKIGVEVDDLFNGYIIHHQYVLCPLQWWAWSESMNIYSWSNIGGSEVSWSVCSCDKTKIWTWTWTKKKRILVSDGDVKTVEKFKMTDAKTQKLSLLWLLPSAGLGTGNLHTCQVWAVDIGCPSWHNLGSNLQPQVPLTPRLPQPLVNTWKDSHSRQVGQICCQAVTAGRASNLSTKWGRQVWQWWHSLACLN